MPWDEDTSTWYEDPSDLYSNPTPPVQGTEDMSGLTDEQLYDYFGIGSPDKDAGTGNYDPNDLTGTGIHALDPSQIEDMRRGDTGTSSPWWKELLKSLIPSGQTPGAGSATPISGAASALGGAATAGQRQNNTADQLRLSAEDAALARQKFAVAAPAARMNTGLRAALGKVATPASVQWGGKGSGLRGEVPKFSGGVLSTFDALKDPQAAALLQQVLQDSLAGQVAGGTTGGGQDAKTTQGAVGEDSTLDKVLGGASLGLTGLQLLQQILANRGTSKTTQGASQPNPDISADDSEYW